MLDKVLIAFLVADFLFVGTGGLLIGIVFATKSNRSHPRTTDDVASNLLLVRTPLDGKSKIPFLRVQSRVRELIQFVGQVRCLTLVLSSSHSRSHFLP